jgi:RND family efflux transporter MFP subunit
MAVPFVSYRLLALAVLALALPACRKGPGSADSNAVAQAGTSKDSAKSPEAGPQLALPVTVEPARDGDLILSILTTGQVRSEAEGKLKFEVGGIVDRVLVRPGQPVRKGQPLVALDPIPFDLQLRKAEAAIDDAKLKYQDMMIDSVISGTPPSAERRLASITRSGLRNAELGLEQAKLDRQRATLFAPFDGTIDRVDATAGARMGAGDPAVTIVDMQHLRIEAAVLEHDIPLVREGGVAWVSSAAAPELRSRGQIIAVLPLIDSMSRAGRTYVRLNGNGVLRPGMSVDVSLEARRLTNRRLVPFKALVERDGRPLVFVVRNDRAYWTYIQPGRNNGFEVEVLPDSATGEIPIKPGDLIIITGHITLTHDAPVKVVRKEGSEIGPPKR